MKGLPLLLPCVSVESRRVPPFSLHLCHQAHVCPLQTCNIYLLKVFYTCLAFSSALPTRHSPSRSVTLAGLDHVLHLSPPLCSLFPGGGGLTEHPAAAPHHLGHLLADLRPPLYLGREEIDFHDVQGCHAGRCQADGFLQEEQCARDQQPLPEVGPMQDEQEPHGEVGQVSPVEHLWGMGE